MRHARHTARRGGFTLLELLVAIGILALVSVIAWRGLSSLLSTRERLEPRADAVRALLAGFGQLERDLAQVPANARLFALPMQALRVTSEDGQPVLQVLRLADSPDASAAAAVELVFYQVLEGALVRRSTPAQRFYPGGASGALESVALVPDVSTMQIRVWRDNIGWIAPVSDADMANAIGVEVQITRRDGSRLRRVFAIG